MLAGLGKVAREWQFGPMSRFPSLPIFLAVFVSACAAPLTALPPPPTGLKAIAIATPQNKTGGDLTVNEDGFMAGLLDDRKTVTVPALLEDDLRVELNKRDFRIVKPDAGTAPVLRTDIRRWQPQSATWSQVTVDLSATVVENGSGRTLWTMDRSGWIVPTEGSNNAIDASTKAAHRIAEDLIEGWTVAPSPERPASP
jgi:hypothetical protein